MIACAGVVGTIRAIVSEPAAPRLSALAIRYFLNESLLVMVILRGAGGWGSGDGRGKIGEQVGRPVEAGTGQEAGRELLRAMFAKKTVDPLLHVGRGRPAQRQCDLPEGAFEPPVPTPGFHDIISLLRH